MLYPFSSFTFCLLSYFRASIEFNRILSLSLNALMRILQDGDMSVWSLAEQTLIKTYKSLLRGFHEIIILEVWKSVKGEERQSKGFTDIVIKMEGRSRRFAIQLFSICASKIKPSKLQKFRKLLIKVLSDIVQQGEDQLLQETLAKSFGPIALYQLSTSDNEQLDPLLSSLLKNVKSKHSRVRRSAVPCLVDICRHSEHRYDIISTITERLLDLLKSESETQENGEVDLLTFDDTTALNTSQLPYHVKSIPSPIIQGILYALRELLRVSIDPQDTSLVNAISPNLCTISLIAFESLTNETDSNIVVSALELLQEVLTSFWNETILSFKEQNKSFDTYFKDLLDILSSFIHKEDCRVTVQVLVISCYCSLSLIMPEQFVLILQQDIEKVIGFLKHSDALLRGQAYYLVGCIAKGCIENQRLADFPTFQVEEQLSFVLDRAINDESSLASKMACNSVFLPIEAITHSEYSYFILVIIQRFLLIPSTAYHTLKSKVISLLTRIDYKTVCFIEEYCRSNQIKHNLPSDYVFSSRSIDLRVIDFLITYLSDSEQRIRKKAAKSIISMLNCIDYHPYLQRREDTLRDSYVKSLKGRNGVSAQLIDSIMVKLVPCIHLSTENNLTKGFYSLVRSLLEQGHEFPCQIVNIISDQILCNSFASDLETQLDCVIVATMMLLNPKEANNNYVFDLFTHIMKLMHIISHIVSGRKPGEKKPTEEEPVIGSIYGQFHYIQLYERMNDAYRLSLSSFERTLFDDISDCVLSSLTRIISIAGYRVYNFLDEIISYSIFHFITKTEHVIDLLHVLAHQILPKDTPTRKGTIRKFEDLFIMCKNTYVSSLSLPLRRQILHLLGDLVVYGVNYRFVDKDLLFLRYLHNVFAPKDDAPLQSPELRASQLFYLTAVHVKRELFLNDSLPLTFTCLSTLVDQTFRESWDEPQCMKAYSKTVDLLYSIEIVSHDENDYRDVIGVTIRMRDEILSCALDRLPHPRAVKLISYIYKVSKEMDSKTLAWLYRRVLKTVEADPVLTKIHILKEKDIASFDRIVDNIPKELIKVNDLREYIHNIDMGHVSWLFKALLLTKIFSNMDIEQNPNLLDTSGAQYDLIYKFIIESISKGLSMAFTNRKNMVDIARTVEHMIKLLLQSMSSIADDNRVINTIKETISNEGIFQILKDHVVSSPIAYLLIKFGKLFERLQCPEWIDDVKNHVMENRLDTQIIRNNLNLSYIRSKAEIDRDMILDDCLFFTLTSYQFDDYIQDMLKKMNGKLDVEIIERIRGILDSLSDKDHLYICKIIKLAEFVSPTKMNIYAILQIVSNTYLMSHIMTYESVIISLKDKLFQNHGEDLTQDHFFIHDLLQIHGLRPCFLQKLGLKGENIPNEDVQQIQLAKLKKGLHDDLGIDEIIPIVEEVIKSFSDRMTIPEIPLNPRREGGESNDESILIESDATIDVNVVNNASQWSQFTALMDVLNSSLDIHDMNLIKLSSIPYSHWMAMGCIAIKAIRTKLCTLSELVSTEDVVISLQYIKHMFYLFEMTESALFKVAVLRNLLYDIYNILFFFMQHLKKIVINESTHEDVSSVLSFFWSILMTPSLEPEVTNSVEELFLSVIKTLAQSSLSLELSVYPFQDNPINFDYHHDPVIVIDNILCLVNTIPPRFSTTFEKIWHQIVIGIDPKYKIPPVATSEQIKTSSFKVLNTLLVLKGFDSTSLEEPMEIIDQHSFTIPVIISDSLKDNFVYLWKDINISSSIDEYLDLISPYVSKYVNFTSTEPELGKECLRGIILLADLFVPNQRAIVKDILFKALDNQQEVYDDDVVSKTQLLLGISKILPLYWLTHQTNKENEEATAQKILKHFKIHIANQRMRKCPAQDEDKTMTPLPRALLLLSLFYLLQNDYFKRVFLNDPLVLNFIKKLNEEDIITVDDPKNPIIEFLTNAGHKPSFLAKEMAQVVRKYVVY